MESDGEYKMCNSAWPMVSAQQIINIIVIIIAIVFCSLLGELTLKETGRLCLIQLRH